MGLQNIMEKRFQVVECRGYGIEYVEFSGTLSECRKYAAKQNKAALQPGSNLVNGNGDPFTYEVREEGWEA